MMAIVKCDKEMCSKNTCTYTGKYTCCFDCDSMAACEEEGDVCVYITCGTSQSQCVHSIKK